MTIMDWLVILEKCLWFGFAGMGFGVLFNVPRRTMFTIWIMAYMGGIVKLLLLHYNQPIVLACLCAAILVGMISIPFAHLRHVPPFVISIPGVIPMVPGIFAYRMVLGFIKLTGDPKLPNYHQVLSETVNNGLKTMLILMSLALGTVMPMLITRQKSAKHLNLIKRDIKRNHASDSKEK